MHFVHGDALERHLRAPQAAARNAYIGALQQDGFGRAFIGERASLLLDVVAAVHPSEDGFVGEDEIAEALSARLESGAKQAKGFKAAARSWFKFLGIYRQRSPRGGRFSEILQRFLRDEQDPEMGRNTTAQSRLSPVASFLEWVSPRRSSLHEVLKADISEFLLQRREAGWSARSVHNAASALRAFFRFTESSGHSAALSRGIASPGRVRRPEFPRCPTWPQVRSLITGLDSEAPTQCRAKAVLLLASVYGMRRSELSRLTLDDLDWQSGVLTVHRSKRGRIQQFPLSDEVASAIACYLVNVRPKIASRCLFLTLSKPYRAAINLGPSMRKVMSRHGEFSHEFGLHALRHACATELLRQGTSLRSIASYLGHRSLHAVSVYAHCDRSALEQVANVDLRECL